MVTYLGVEKEGEGGVVWRRSNDDATVRSSGLGKEEDIVSFSFRSSLSLCFQNFAGIFQSSQNFQGEGVSNMRGPSM